MSVLVNEGKSSTPSIISPENSIHYRWEFFFKSSPDQIWPYIANTNRFDKDSGLPAYDLPESSSAAGLTNTRRQLRIKMYGIPLEWVEEPFEWVRPYHFGIIRNYKKGVLQPIKQLRVFAELNETKEGGTHLIYKVWATPWNWIGRLIIPIQIGKISFSNFAKTFKEYDTLAQNNIAFEEVKIAASLPVGSDRRLQSLRQQLVQANHAPELVNMLIETVKTADDITLSQMRPYQLAELWHKDRNDVLSLMLQATRLGMLNFKWDLLCPLCRVSKESATSLMDVTQTVHCDTCNISYNANFDQSVELTFTPNPAIRKIEEQQGFCTSGPEAMPHVAVQQLLLPGERRTITPKLEPGRYRLRSPQIEGMQVVEVSMIGQDQVHIQPLLEGWQDELLEISPTPTLLLDNLLDTEMLIIFERMAWADHAVTAAEVTTLQQFRDLFAEEALRPGDQISVGSLTILFTDLCDSTRMYREIGDAPAFGLVMDHFDVLREAIREENGAIVKTIGDAVMAVFLRPVSAIRAVNKAQERLTAQKTVPPLRLKAAIHYGPSIAVTLNERLDYFGSTVNIASRLEKFSKGGEIIISDVVFKDPEVQDYVNHEEMPLDLEMFDSTLKGYDDECFNLHRMRVPEQE